MADWLVVGDPAANPDPTAAYSGLAKEVLDRMRGNSNG